MKKGKFILDIYKAPIYYIFNCSQKSAKKYFKKEGLKINDYLWGVAHTFSFKHDDNTVYGIWVKEKNIENLAHEVFHLIGYIFHDRKLYYDPNNEEPWAYLIEYLMKEFLTKLK